MNCKFALPASTIISKLMLPRACEATDRWIHTSLGRHVGSSVIMPSLKKEVY